MARLGWVSKTLNEKEKLENCKKYFAVSSLSLIPNTIEVALGSLKERRYHHMR